MGTSEEQDNPSQTKPLETQSSLWFLCPRKRSGSEGSPAANQGQRTQCLPMKPRPRQADCQNPQLLFMLTQLPPCLPKVSTCAHIQTLVHHGACHKQAATLHCIRPSRLGAALSHQGPGTHTHSNGPPKEHLYKGGGSRGCCRVAGLRMIESHGSWSYNGQAKQRYSTSELEIKVHTN